MARMSDEEGPEVLVSKRRQHVDSPCCVWNFGQMDTISPRQLLDEPGWPLRGLLCVCAAMQSIPGRGAKGGEKTALSFRRTNAIKNGPRQDAPVRKGRKLTEMVRGFPASEPCREPFLFGEGSALACAHRIFRCRTRFLAQGQKAESLVAEEFGDKAGRTCAELRAAGADRLSLDQNRSVQRALVGSPPAHDGHAKPQAADDWRPPSTVASGSWPLLPAAPTGSAVPPGCAISSVPVASGTRRTGQIDVLRPARLQQLGDQAGPAGLVRRRPTPRPVSPWKYS